jgi:hypothetical protein
VGNRAEGNQIEDLAHVAILFYGNDHHIACNRILRVCQETGDAGAIYSGQDWTARGTVIEANRVADVGASPLLPKPVAAIYLDDQLSGTVVRNNLLQRVAIGVLVGGGRDNLIQGNGFDQCRTTVFLDGRGLTWQKGWLTDAGSPLLRKMGAVPFQGPAYRKYPGLAQVLTDRPGTPLGNRITGNRSVGPFVMDILPEAAAWFIATDNRGDAELPAAFPGGCGSMASVGK